MNGQAYAIDVGRAIQQIRKGKDWSQEQLARRVGVSQSAVNHIEGVLDRVTIRTIRRYANALNTSVLEIVEHAQCPD